MRILKHFHTELFYCFRRPINASLTSSVILPFVNMRNLHFCVNCPFKSAEEFLYRFSHQCIMIPVISSLSNLICLARELIAHLHSGFWRVITEGLWNPFKDVPYVFIIVVMLRGLFASPTTENERERQRDFTLYNRETFSGMNKCFQQMKSLFLFQSFHGKFPSS